MTKSITRTGLTRRSVLRGATALGAAALILPAGMRAASAEPKKGGILRIGMGSGSTSDSLDPGSWADAYTQVFATSRHNYLTEIDADGALQPEIAESWEASADAATWTFKIRQGVTFHSGKALDAEDVIASINHHRGEDSTSAAKPIVEGITEIKADGSHTVVVTLESGNADFPFIMSDYHLAILPAKDGAIDPASTDGCGAYVLDSFEPGVEARLTRNPNYWKTDRAHFDGIELLPIVDGAARQNALISGQVDVIDRVDLNTVHLLKRAANINVLSVTGSQHYVFPMDSRAAPFSDNNVRMAIKHAVDREELVEKILNGYGTVGNDHPISTANRFHAGDALEQRTYDADKAKWYLKQAGMDSLDIELSVSDAAFGGAVDAGVLMSEKSAAAGINLTVKREPADGYWSNIWMKKPFAASYWGGRPTEDWMFSTAYKSGANWNESFWENARFDQLLAAARSELDNDKRREMYVEMQGLVRDEGSTIIPMFANYVMAHSTAVVTPEKVAPNWTMDGFRVAERWWFA
ncbi:MAG: ABC transporter substrate-binding protein [Rhodobacteraceae bacterium]|nr:ABC transporter substrate-binding protein [Paracoccaceae bacterium]